MKIAPRISCLKILRPTSISTSIISNKCYQPTFSRTRGSSIAARFSRGDKRTWPNSGPPTYSTKFPSSSLKAVRTSSSSSTDSAEYRQPVYQSIVPYRAAYHLKRGSTRLLCDQLPAQGQLLRVDEWHSILKVHHHASTLSVPAQQSLVLRGCALGHYLQFINKNGYGVELVSLVWTVRHYEGL